MKVLVITCDDVKLVTAFYLLVIQCTAKVANIIICIAIITILIIDYKSLCTSALIITICTI